MLTPKMVPKAFPGSYREIALFDLAALPTICCAGLFLLALVSVRLHLPVLTILAGLFQIATMSIIVSLYGLCMMVFPLAISPVFLPPLIELLWRVAGMPAALPINLLLSIGPGRTFVLATSACARATPTAA
jgi:hypothetical protein